MSAKKPKPAPRRHPWLLWLDAERGERLIFSDGVVHAEQLAGERWKRRIPVNVEQGIRDRAIVAMAHALRPSRPALALVVTRCRGCAGGLTAADVLEPVCPHCGVA